MVSRRGNPSPQMNAASPNVWKQPLVLVAFLLLWLSAQGYHEMQRQAALRLLRRAVLVHGGLAALAAAPNEISKVTISPIGGRWPAEHITLIRKGASTLLVSVHGPGIERACVTGHGGWYELDGVSSRSALPEWSALQNDNLALGNQSLAEVSTLDLPLENLGLRRLPAGGSAAAVLVRNDGGDLVLFFNRSSGRLAALGYWGGDGSQHGDPTYIYEFQDYRRVGRVIRPTRGVIFADGCPSFAITAQMPKTRIPLPDSLFSFPSMSSNPGSVRASLDFHRGEPVVACAINGGPPVRFIIDTGAYRTYVSPEVAKELHLRSDGAFGTTVWTRAATMEMSRVREIRIGGLKVGPIPVQIADSATARVMRTYGYDGVLGYNFLGRFRIILDYPAKTVEFRPRSPRSAPRQSVHFEVIAGTLVIVCNVDGRALKFTVDTGSQKSYLGSDDAVSMDLKNPHYDGYFPYSEGVKVSMLTADIDNLQLGGQSITPATVNYLDSRSPYSRSLWTLRNLIGNNILRNYRVTIDYGSERLWLTRGPTG